MLAPPPTFAVPPLANRLLSRQGLEVRRLDPKTGGYGEPLRRDYSGIELDLWGYRFLNDLDLFLGPRIGVPAMALAPNAMQTAMAAKNVLAAAIADRLQPVLEGDGAVPVAARLAFRARLRIRVSAAYATAVVVVLPGTTGPGGVRLVPAGQLRDRTAAHNRSIPMPLRAYPSMPQLVTIEAVASEPQPTTVKDATQWSCRIVYRHPMEVPDRLGIELYVDQPASAAPGILRSTGDAAALFDVLAQYMEIAPQLWAILTDADPAAAAVRLQAIETYVALIKDVAAAWTIHRGYPRIQIRQLDLEDSNAVQRYCARLKIGETNASLTLERQHADPSMDWPSIAAVTADGTEIPLEAVLAVGGEDVRRLYRFRREDAVKGLRALGDGPQFALTFGPLHPVRVQNLRAGFWVERNVALLGEAGPVTRPDFIFRTPKVAFATPIAPMLDVNARLTVGRWSDDPATNPLQTVFDILRVDRNPIAITVSHERTLPDGLAISTPVGLLPAHIATAKELPQLIEAIRHWLAENAISEGALKFEIRVHAMLEGAPLLTLRQVVLTLAAEEPAVASAR